MVFRGRTTAGSLATVEYLRYLGDSVVTGADGTFALRSGRAPRRTYRVGITFTDLARRSTRTWTCVSPWDARRESHGRVRCRLGAKGLSARARPRAARTAVADKVAESAAVSLRPPDSGERAASKSVHVGTRAAESLQIAPVTTTLVGRYRGLDEFPMMIGDVSGKSRSRSSC